MAEPNQRTHDERGIAFVAALLATTALGAIVYATTIVASTEVGDSRRDIMEMKAFALAEAGLERAIHFTRSNLQKTNFKDPMLAVAALYPAGQRKRLFTAVPFKDGKNSLGEFTVSAIAVKSAAGYDIQIDSTGYFPRAPENMPLGKKPHAKAVRTIIRVEDEVSPIFDYAYFINNWAWLYGNSIVVNGNVRSNGQFDAGGYSPTISGQALYDAIGKDQGNRIYMTGYRDLNGDGLEDGLDGGIFSAWDIVGAGRVRGVGGQTRNQHEFGEQVPMPNLTDLTRYEKAAVTSNGRILIGNTVYSDAIYGDAPTDKKNIYLKGTAKNPIKIEGTVVVRGNVMISGYVTGQGSIYASGNIYVPNNLIYSNKLTSPRPTQVTLKQQEAWLTANQNNDLVGFYAKENIVLGDVTNGTWRSNVGWWLGNSQNQSAEDAGEDGIPNTRNGRDGIRGTADDDVLEGDGKFTTELYTAEDQALGLIPAGKKVGDPIPGTGEDIDGDGQYDGTIGLKDLDLPAALNTTNWGGNMPATGINRYSDIASMTMTKVEGVFYTNHAFAWMTRPGSSSVVELNGALVARNESIIYGAKRFDMNYDNRLLGGETSLAKHYFELPKTLAPVKTLSWGMLSFDPHAVDTTK